MARIGELIGPNGEVMHPKTSAEVVYLEDGRSVEQVLSDDIDYGNVVFQDNSYKFDSDVEDDFAKTVIIKGQTYQNILPEPSTHVLTNNKGMFKVNEGLDPNVEIVDGVSKSAILSGQTLVNVIDKIWFHSEAKHFFYIGLKQYEVNKDYLFVMFNAPNEITQIYLGNSDTTMMWRNYTTDFIRNGSTVSLKVTCPSNYDGSTTVPHFRFGSSEPSLDEVKQMKAMLIPYQEGMENWNIPYFTGMSSVKMPVLTTTGKNLLNISPDTLERVTINGKTGVITENTTRCTTEYIKATPKDNLFLKRFDNNYKVAVRYYHNDNLVNRELNSMGSFVTDGNLRVDYNEYYNQIRLIFAKKDDSEVTPQEVSSQQIMLTSSRDDVFEPYKVNILSTPEEVVLRSFNGAKDTLNLMTGEYVQRIKEMVLNGNETYKSVTYTHNNTNLRFDLHLDDIKTTTYDGLLCDKLPVFTRVMAPEGEHTKSYIAGHADSNRLVIIIEKSKLPSEDIKGFKAWLQSNPLTIQYELKTPITKTVDLSSSGNWDMITLNGSEESIILGNLANRFFVPIGDKMYYSPSEVSISCSSFGVGTANTLSSGQVCAFSTTSYYKGLMFSMSNISTVDEFKKYLKSNPMTIVYKLNDGYAPECGFAILSNGHIIQSSGADSSLIPTLDYQAKTSNSYVMDLMKANTRYTMKAKSASGTFTIDGTSYNVGTNTAFTSPSSMTNKFLVMSNKTNEEVMILEGDVISKAIPHFKGIKSAFEDESKIEVLSTGKNLIHKPLQAVVNLDINGSKCSINKDGVFTVTGTATRNGGRLILGVDNKFVKPFKLLRGKTYIMSLVVENDMTNGVFPKFWLSEPTGDNAAIVGVGGSWAGDSLTAQVTPTRDIMVVLGYNVLEGETYNATFNVQLEESSTQTSYEPYKSNSTKIPLLSPLRSLPNGVCDEIVLDRENNKAKIIQRVGKVVLDGNEGWTRHTVNEETVAFYYADTSFRSKSYEDGSILTDFVPRNSVSSVKSSTEGLYTDGRSNVVCVISKKRLATEDVASFKKFLNSLKPSVQYQLATPIITEVDLEGFPYIYKDGHIFLNGEIAPTAGIEYSLNQGQRIAGQVETLQRHEKQFYKLEQYFADLVYSDYNYALLRFSEKLHQQEGDV